VVARQTLKTVAGDRLYTIRLDVYAPQFSKYEQAAFAVAASMKFSGTTVDVPATAVEEAAATTETEEEPATKEVEEEASPTEGKQEAAAEAKESG
jgi:hypothetical protein